MSYSKNRLQDWRLRTRYGITLDQYTQMELDQESKCKICDLAKPLHVDHCHSTGKVRGLLCHSCNNGLGCFRDNPDLIDKALNYLRLK